MSQDRPASLVLERRIHAPLAEIYRLLVDPEELRHWLGPDDFRVTQLKADVRVGGRLLFRMRKLGGGDYGAQGEFQELVRNERVSFTWSWDQAPNDEELDRTQTLVTISLRAEGHITVLTLTHAQLPDRASAERHAAGWKQALDKLVSRAVTRQKGQIMKPEIILAAIAVSDMDRAMAWYQKLIGRAYDERPMKEAAEWRLQSHCGLQLVADKERAGRSMVTIGVADIERLVADIGSRGIEAHATPPGQGPYRLAQVRDPDGNLVTFSQDQRAS